MYITHPDYAPRKLTRTDHASWSLDTVTFTWGPFLDENTSSQTMAAAAVTGSTTLTSSSSFFDDPGHVGAQFKISGLLERTADITAQNTYCTAVEMNAGEVLEVLIEGTWTDIVTLQVSYDQGTSWNDVEQWTANAHELFTVDRDNVQYRLGIKTGDYTAGTATCKLSHQHDGYCTVTAVNSATEAAVTVNVELPHANATELWSEGAWSPYRGYPAVVAFWEQRLVFAGSTHRPLTLWASQVDDYENMESGTDDSDAWIYTLAGKQLNKVKWMLDADVLLVGTSGGEWSFGYPDEPTTPTNVNAKNLKTNIGSGSVQPVMISNTLVFPQRNGKRLRALSYRYDKDSYQVPDVSVRAEHLFASPIVDMAWTDQPRPVLWMVRSDGRMVGCTIDFEAGLVAFHHHFTTDNTSESDIEAVCVVPGADHDEVYLIVKRTINGSTVRYVEILDAPDWTDMADAVFADCALTGTALEEGLGDYTEQDTPGRLALDENAGTVSVTALDSDENVYSYQDYTASYFNGDYKIEFKLNISAISTDQKVGLWALSNTLDNLKDLEDSDLSYDAVLVEESSGSYYLTFRKRTTGDTTELESSTQIAISLDTDYYITVYRDYSEGKHYLYVYTDAERTTHVSGSPVVLEKTVSDLRYMHIVNNYKDGSTGNAASMVITGVTQGYTAVSGLSHLEAETVKVVGDGVVQADKTVSSGAITAATPAVRFVVGLPYTAQLKMMRIEAGAVAGTAQGRIKKFSEVGVRMYKTAEMQLGLDEDDLTTVDFATPGKYAWEDTNIPFAHGYLFTGDKRETPKQGRSRDGNIILQSDDPVPFDVTAVMIQLETNEY